MPSLPNSWDYEGVNAFIDGGRSARYRPVSAAVLLRRREDAHGPVCAEYNGRDFITFLREGVSLQLAQSQLRSGYYTYRVKTVIDRYVQYALAGTGWSFEDRQLLRAPEGGWTYLHSLTRASTRTNGAGERVRVMPPPGFWIPAPIPEEPPVTE